MQLQHIAVTELLLAGSVLNVCWGAMTDADQENGLAWGSTCTSLRRMLGCSACAAAAVAVAEPVEAPAAMAPPLAKVPKDLPALMFRGLEPA
jgi:hypothetical protein